MLLLLSPHGRTELPKHTLNEQIHDVDVPAFGLQFALRVDDTSSIWKRALRDDGASSFFLGAVISVSSVSSGTFWSSSGWQLSARTAPAAVNATTTARWLGWRRWSR
jgi:hypothetical protein